MEEHKRETLLEVAGLTKAFGPVRAVTDLSFAVRRGEIVGLLGPNGAGKTTVMRMLVGYLVPSAGSIRIAGGDIFRAGRKLKEQLGYLPENVPLYGEMTVHEYLTMVARLKGATRGAVDDVIALLDLGTMRNRPTGQLSRGYRQRVGLAQCLVTDPQLLILDEPATGLDPNQISEFRAHLRRWRARKAILLSTHILAEALMLCDRVLIMSRGRLAAAGTPEALAGHDQEGLATQISVRGGQGSPLDDLAQGMALGAAPVGDGAVWRIEGPLDRDGRLQLAAHLTRGGWEILEWNSGLSALEQVFRRLTLEEGSQREGEEAAP